MENITENDFSSVMPDSLDSIDYRSPYDRFVDSMFASSDTSTPSDANSYLEGLFSSTGENILQSMQFNSTEAEKSRAWSERMANTAYQRAVADLRKAGLSPLLAYGAAGQAATPNSTSASVNTVSGDTFGSLMTVLAALMSSSAEIMQVFSTLKPKSTRKAGFV